MGLGLDLRVENRVRVRSNPIHNRQRKVSVV
jgi:hypothetical protein